ncbi:hypothetical protein CDZ97_14785 [Mameliella alba]|nr:hypothetical protein CDZ95_13305 [Mameliella alba]OWV57548.1 hypothetical protein CDZ98_16315 [Mameliella alba]OWV63337.1 hypothetical protein CDZ97_14785 [Mameliella alba]
MPLLPCRGQRHTPDKSGVQPPRQVRETLNVDGYNFLASPGPKRLLETCCTQSTKYCSAGVGGRSEEVMTAIRAETSGGSTSSAAMRQRAAVCSRMRPG